MFSVVAGLILLLLLPTSAIWLLGNAIIEQSSVNQRAAAEDALEKRAEDISAYLDPENFFDKHFRRFYEELYNGQPVDAERVRQLSTAFSAGQLGFYPAVFAEGKLLTPVELLGEHETALVDAWETMQNYSRKPGFTTGKRLNTLFGAAYGTGLLQTHEGRLMKINGYKGDGFIFYARNPGKSRRDGVYIVLWTVPVIEELTKFLPSELAMGIKMSIRLSAETAAKPDHQHLSVKKRIGERFLFVEKTYTGLNPKYARTMLSVFLLFLVMIICMLLKDSDLTAGMRTASIRMKLVGLILYSVALPLAGLTYFGWKYVAERRELLIQDAYIACHDSINEFENNFEKEKARLLSQFRSFKHLPEMKSDPAPLLPMFRKKDVDRHINWIEVRDINADVILTIQRQETAEQLGLLGKAVARLGINNFLGHRLQGKALSLNASEVLVQEFLEGPFGGWARIFESPDELHQVSFGGFEIFWYWDVFEDPDMKAAFIVVDQHVRWAVRNYLIANLKHRISFGSGALRMFAWSTVYSELWPEDTVAADELMRFIRQVMRSSSSQNSIIRWNNADWVAAGAPGKQLADSILLSLYPLEEIEREISGIRSDLTWGVLFALILALLVGTLFSHTIIRPVASLMLGVQALRRRDADCRLEILQNDELGRLSATFNTTSEALADILSAKAIQKQLIPEKAPEIEGFTADLIYIPTADLGGDYCDIMPLNNGCWLLVIGDVTGHGVSSAMVTTMIKAVVSDYAMNGGLSLHDMFICLNELLFTQFKRKKCMTLFAAVLDSSSGRLDCINAGHPLPLHFSDGCRQPVAIMGHPPLGFTIRNQEFPQTSLQLANGDCLVLYTDIFVETADKSGQPYGNAGFSAVCEKYLHLPPAAMREEILNAVMGCSDKELDDDMTLIIIKRNHDSSDLKL